MGAALTSGGGGGDAASPSEGMARGTWGSSSSSPSVRSMVGQGLRAGSMTVLRGICTSCSHNIPFSKVTSVTLKNTYLVYFLSL